MWTDSQKLARDKNQYTRNNSTVSGTYVIMMLRRVILLQCKCYENFFFF